VIASGLLDSAEDDSRIPFECSIRQVAHQLGE
jgi:hypothetical protein